MASAYQYSAFQFDAFQIDAPVLGDCEQDYVESGYLEAGYICGADQVSTGGPGRRFIRPKRVYLERDGQILVFNKPTDAAAYIAAEKAQEKPVVQKPQKVKKPKVVPVKQPETIIKIDVLEVLAQRFQVPDYRELIQKHEYEAMHRLHAYLEMLQDEEEIELLLLAA